MVGWHHCLSGHEFEQTPGDSDGQQSLVCCSPWDPKESDMMQQLKVNNKALEECSETEPIGKDKEHFCFVIFFLGLEV